MKILHYFYVGFLNSLSFNFFINIENNVCLKIATICVVEECEVSDFF